MEHTIRHYSCTGEIKISVGSMQTGNRVSYDGSDPFAQSLYRPYMIRHGGQWNDNGQCWYIYPAGLYGALREGYELMAIGFTVAYEDQRLRDMLAYMMDLHPMMDPAWAKGFLDACEHGRDTMDILSGITKKSDL